jgi:DNA-binding response OmpR family regulator
MSEKRLLVCDDEPAVGRFVENVAESLGYDLCITTSGEMLMEVYDDFRPTTILLDMVMPGVDGNEVIAWLAKRGCSARLIIMTGYHSDYADHAKILADYKRLGPAITVRKPFGITELRAALTAA